MKLAGLDFIYQLNIYLNVDAVLAILESSKLCYRFITIISKLNVLYLDSLYTR